VLRSHDEILETLHSAGVLSSDDGYLWFTYRYIYYFYIGKHLADHLDEALQGDIERICEKMYTEENANVLIFLIHHTRDQRVIDEVLLRGYVTFDSVDPARLDRDETRHILEFLETVPELAIEYRNIEVERRRRLETKDAVDRELGNIESEEVDEIAELDETIADIARSIRMIDVVGQILRNRSGSLLRPQATDLARAGFESGLKFLSFWLDLTRTDQEILIGLISDALKEDGSVSDENVGRAAGRTYLMLTYGVCIGVIRRIASALASEDLLDVFDSLEKEDSGSIAVQLINVAMRLDISKSIPKRKIETVNAKLDNNPMARRVLKHLLVEHVYLHDVPVRDKQWISDKLGLPMKTQRLVDARSKRKRSGPTNP
jgi:hypothetical protein